MPTNVTTRLVDLLVGPMVAWGLIGVNNVVNPQLPLEMGLPALKRLPPGH